MLWSINIVKRLSRAAALCFLTATLAACGYGFGSDAPSVLKATSPGVRPTIKIKSVDNPTLYPWLPYTIRTEFRDELAARNVALWVDSGRADYEVALKVHSFTIRSWLTDPDDSTSLYTASLALEGIFYKSGTNEEIWRSRPMWYSQSYDHVQERAAAEELTRELVRRLISSMRQAF